MVPDGMTENSQGGVVDKVEYNSLMQTHHFVGDTAGWPAKLVPAEFREHEVVGSSGAVK